MISLLSLFSGIGAFEKALQRLQIPFELINYCEIDPNAARAYSLIHNIPESKNAVDVTKIDCRNIPFGVDLLTYGFPCQDISAAGLQKGFTDENGKLTRSGLFFEALRIIEETRPKIAIAENVKALTSKRFQKEFEIVLSSLQAAGYVNFWRVLNSKDYGIPQNRERVFIVSIRQDLAHGFTFPAPFPLEYRLKDFLETTVDEKYYIKESSLNYILSSGTKSFYYKPEIDLDVARPIMATITKQHRAGLDNYISESYAEKGEKTPVDFLRIPEPTAQGYKDAFAGDCVNVGFPNSKTRRGRVTPQMYAALITSSQLGVVVPAENSTPVCPPRLRIRKLTPLECFRLMSFDDKDFYTLRDHGFKDSAIYKAAGNSIVVDVLQYIFKALFEQYKEIFVSKQETFFDLLGESGVDDSANNQTSIFDYL